MPVLAKLYVDRDQLHAMEKGDLVEEVARLKQLLHDRGDDVDRLKCLVESLESRLVMAGLEEPW